MCIRDRGSIGHDFSICIPYHIKESNVESLDMVFLDEVHLAAVHLPCCTPIAVSYTHLYGTLYRVYSQMGFLFSKQYLLYQELNAFDKAEKYAYLRCV